MSDDHEAEWYAREWREFVKRSTSAQSPWTLQPGSFRARTLIKAPHHCIDVIATLPGEQVWPRWTSQRIPLKFDIIPALQPAQGPVAVDQADPASSQRRRRTPADRVSGVLRRLDLSGLAPWGGLAALTGLLADYAGGPSATVTNYLAAFAVIVALAAIIQARK